MIRGGNGEAFPVSDKPRLTGDQERQRMDGLRVLARVIARHYLAHPELYPVPNNGSALAQADGNAGRKEADE